MTRRRLTAGFAAAALTLYMVAAGAQEQTVMVGGESMFPSKNVRQSNGVIHVVTSVLLPKM
jgi:uncharacterized surface protein with fasciclin (FAS1) repeats